MLAIGETYRDLGRGDYFTNRDPEHQTRRLVARTNGSDTA
jgi:hypothetical protein